MANKYGFTNPTLTEPSPESGAPLRARLALDYITLDSQLQSRELKPAVVKDYVSVLRRGEEFPPVVVVRDGKDRYYLVDGHHRVAATRQLLGIHDIAVDIVDGTFTDALWLSWGANRGHGLRRTQKDKRRAILAALRHPRWHKKTNRAIAQHIGCDHKTVVAMRRRLAAGEFPTDGTGSPNLAAPSKSAILRACQLLTRVQPEQAREFNEAELAIVRAGYKPVHRLLFGAKTLTPGEPKDTEDNPKGGMNASDRQD